MSSDTPEHRPPLPQPLEWLFRDRPPLSEEEIAHNSRYRSWSVLFGDGAGAVVLRWSDDPDAGIVARSLRSDGAVST